MFPLSQQFVEQNEIDICLDGAKDDKLYFRMNFKRMKKTQKKNFEPKHRSIAQNVTFDTMPNNETLHTPMVYEYPKAGTKEQTNQSLDSLHSYVLRPNTQKKGAEEKIDLKRKQICKTDQRKSKVQRLNKTDPFACST